MGRPIANKARFTVRFTATGIMAHRIAAYTERRHITAQALAALAITKYLAEEDASRADHTTDRPSRVD
jgi:hypothetical protein